MRLVDIREAPGCRLGLPIRDANGRVLLAEGVPLTAGVCDALIRRGYMHLYVADGIGDDIVPRDTLAPKTRSLAVSTARDCFQRLGKGESLPFKHVMATIDAILSDLQSARDVVLEFQALRSASEYTYTHSVNVCVYSLLVGQMMSLTPQDLRIMGAGALLHDVGKLLCADLCAKTGPLDDGEWARVRQHPTDGFEMLRHHHELHLYVAHTAFQHHERLDGSGYPRGLSGEQILPCARIVAVADSYDAMTSDRPHACARPAYDAMAEIASLAGIAFDPHIVRLFMRRMAVFPVGTPVGLEDGTVGVVVGQTKDADRPMVRLLGRAGHLLPKHDVVEAFGHLRIAQALTRWPPWLEQSLQARTPPDTEGQPAIAVMGQSAG